MKKLNSILTGIFILLSSVLTFAQTTQTFTNSNATTIPATGTGPAVANPYPSTVTVSGMPGTITNVTVSLTGISHTWPDDLDIILVSPAGQQVTLMSDCGAGTDLVGVNLVLSDAAGSSLVDGGPTVSGTFKPTDINDGTDTYPAPGPGTVSPAALLSTFNTYDANGTWSLYIYDDTGIDQGTMASWSITVTTSGCLITIPGGAIDEGEVCGTNTNDGTCYYASPYGSISCGQTISGTEFYSSSGGYDSDEFQFTVTSATTVTVTYNSEYPLYIAIVDLNDCSQPINQDNGTTCSLQTFSIALNPGTYAVVLEASFANSPYFECGPGNMYYVTLDMAPVTPVITPSGATTFCQPGSVDLTSTSGTSYLWSPGGATTQTLNVTASGSYTVTATINGCAATTSAATVVSVTPNTAVSFSGFSGPYCDNDFNYVTLTPSLYGGTFSGPGIVANGDGYTVTVGTPLAITDNAPAGTDYTVTPSGLSGFSLGSDYFLGSICFKSDHTWVGDLKATLTSPNGTSVVLFDRPGVPATTFGCSGNGIDVTFIPGTGTEMETVCNGAVPTISGNFNAFGGADLNALNDGSDPNGTWILNISDAAAGDVGNITGLVFNFGTYAYFDPSTAGAGTHTIDYDFNNCAGCSSNASQTVTVNAAPAVPTISASGATTFCQGGSVTLTSSSATNNVWTPGGATSQGISATASGAYSVTVTANGCSSTSLETGVFVNQLPGAVYTGLGGPYCVSNTTPVTLTPNAKGGTFSGPGITGNGNVGSASLSGTPVSIPDANPSGVSSTITPSGIAGSALGTNQFLTSVCLKITHTYVGDLKATLTSPNGTTVVLFDQPDGGSCYGNNLDATFVPGTGTEVETACNADIVPAIFGVFNAFNGANINSLNDGSNPNGNWVLNVSDLVGTDVGSVTSFTLNFGTTGVFNPSVAGVGTHTITYTNTSCAGCSGVTTQTVVVNDVPTATISGTASFCIGGSTTLSSSSATGNVWSPGGATTQTLTVTSAGGYSVTVTNGSGCSATSATTTVTQNPLPATPTITASGATTFCDPGTVDLTSSSATGNVWSPGGATTQTITASATGSYTVTVTDGNGCVSAASAATDVTEENCTGIDNASAINGLNIFPNPASESLNIEFTSNEVTCLEVRMTNTMGQLVYSDVKTTFSGTYKNTFSVVGFATGNYNLQVITDKEMMNKKVIIK